MKGLSSKEIRLLVDEMMKEEMAEMKKKGKTFSNPKEAARAVSERFYKTDLKELEDEELEDEELEEDKSIMKVKDWKKNK